MRKSIREIEREKAQMARINKKSYRAVVPLWKDILYGTIAILLILLIWFLPAIIHLMKT